MNILEIFRRWRRRTQENSRVMRRYALEQASEALVVRVATYNPMDFQMEPTAPPMDDLTKSPAQLYPPRKENPTVPWTFDTDEFQIEPSAPPLHLMKSSAHPRRLYPEIPFSDNLSPQSTYNNTKCASWNPQQHVAQIENSFEFLLDLSPKPTDHVVNELTTKKETFLNVIKGTIPSIWIPVLMKIISKLCMSSKGHNLLKEICCDKFHDTIASYVCDVSTKCSGIDGLQFLSYVVIFLDQVQNACLGNNVTLRELIIKTSQAVHGVEQFHNLKMDRKVKVKLENLEATLKTVKRKSERGMNIECDISPLLVALLLSRTGVDGMKKDMLFVNQENKSGKSPILEGSFLVKLILHLFKLNNKKEEIVVITNGEITKKCVISMTGQYKELKGLNVKVLSSCTGLKANIVLLLFVFDGCEDEVDNVKCSEYILNAFQGAQSGLYMFGNIDCLENIHRMWKDIRELLLKNNALLSYLPLECPLHRHKEIKITSQYDFQSFRSGGCYSLCAALLLCGHTCKRKCHFDDKEHKNYVCHEPCKRLCPRGHKCLGKCHQVCAPCQVKVTYPGGTKNCCNVSILHGTLQTSQQEMYATQKEAYTKANKSKCIHKSIGICNEKVKVCLPCKHTQFVSCTLSLQLLNPKLRSSALVDLCKEPCGIVLQCGHICQGTCGTCNGGKSHVACTQEIRDILECGHRLTTVCSNPVRQCLQKCSFKCPHGRCLKQCGVRCLPCKRKCKLRCKHSKCNKLCYEICDREPCKEPCEKALPCGHQCIGFCGEPCPRWCRHCDKHLVSKWDNMGTTRFVFLVDCQHTVRAPHLDEKSRKAKKDLKLLTCPLPHCGKGITSTYRYINYSKMFYRELCEKTEAHLLLE